MTGEGAGGRIQDQVWGYDTLSVSLTLCLSLGVGVGVEMSVFVFIIEGGKPKGLCEMRRLRFQDRRGNGDLSDSDDAYELGTLLNLLQGVVSGLGVGGN